MKNVWITGLALGLTTAVWAEDPITIDRVAPENSIAVVGVDDFGAALARMKRTALWDLWQTDHIQELKARMCKEFFEEGAGQDLDALLEDLGVEKDTLAWPTGATGLAVFPVMSDELEPPKTGVLLLADFGPDAEKVQSLVQALIERGEEEKELTSEQEEMRGHTLTIITFPEPETEEPDWEPGMGQFDPTEFMPDPSSLMGEARTFYYLPMGTRLVVSTDRGAINGVLDVAEGEQRSSIHDREQFHAARSKLGDCDAYGILFVDALMEMLASADEMGMMMMLGPMIEENVGEIESLAMGLRMDGPSAMMEQTFFASMPNGKVGLTALVDHPSPLAAAPAFVGSETMQYMRVSFDLQGAVALVRQFVEMMMGGMMMDPEGEGPAEYFAAMDRMAGTLGTDIHVAQTITRPFKADSERSLVAVRCNEPQEFEDALAGLASEIGFEPRDFLGQRIYTLDDPMALMDMGPMGPGMPMPAASSEPIACGIGGGYVFMGNEDSVEKALRTTGQADLHGLAEDPTYQRAVRPLGSRPVIAWGYSNGMDYFEGTVAVQEAVFEQTMKDIRDQFGDEADDIMGQMPGGGPFAMFDFDYELLGEYLGPWSWEVRSTDDGFLGRSLWFAASEAADD